MPVGIRRDQQVQGGGSGTTAGLIRIVESVAHVHQFVKKTGEKVGQPNTCLRLKFQPLDANRQPKGEEEYAWLQAGYGVEHIWPGNADDTPTGDGTVDNNGFGQEGDYFVPVYDGAGLADNSEAANFMNELVNLGFDEKHIPEDGNLRWMEGLEIVIRPEKVVKPGKKDWTYIMPESIKLKPYEAAGKKAPAGKPAAAAKPAAGGAKPAAAKPAAAAAPTPAAAASNGTVSDDEARELATNALIQTINKNKVDGQAGAITLKQLPLKLSGAILALKDKAKQEAVRNLLKETDADGFLALVCEANSLAYDGDTIAWQEDWAIG